MKEREIKQSKLQIQSLAELCIYELYRNKFLNNQKERYSNQINFIKKILMNNSKIEKKIDKTNQNMTLIAQIKNFNNSLISSNLVLKKEENKLLNKINSYKDELFQEDIMNKPLLSNIQSDNILLIYQLEEKDDIIKRLNKEFEQFKNGSYFKENKREIKPSNKWGEYYLNVNLNKLSENMMAECQNFIQFRNKCEKREKEKNKIRQKIEIYKELIIY